MTADSEIFSVQVSGTDQTSILTTPQLQCVVPFIKKTEIYDQF